MSTETIAEWKARVAAQPLDGLTRIDSVYIKVRMLFDYCQIINEHEGELKEPACKKLIELGVPASQQLWTYIILEICSFYDHINTLIKKTPTLPKPPQYFKDLKKEVRHLTAHEDNWYKNKSREDWIRRFEVVDKIGFEKIITDFELSYTQVNKQIKSLQ